MLGVLPEYRNRGVGRMLKLRQREDALARGIELIEWTFDPLELKNAFFNIERLGAIVRRYVENQYGITASPLHGGLPTDRCYAEWWLRFAARRGGAGRRLRPRSAVRDASTYPADIAVIRRAEPDRAREIQKATGDALRRTPSTRGLAVTGFERSANAGDLPAGAMGMKIERVTLRQIRMPLVHFFETSFGRTYRARHHPGGSGRAKALPAGAK